MAALNPLPMTASSDQPLELAEHVCTPVQVDLSDEQQSLLTLRLVRALARQAAAEAWATPGRATQPENIP